jgi:PLP dependent protein
MLADNLKIVRQNICATAARCGRDPEQIKLVAVSKTFPVAAMKEAIVAGQLLFGENYIQEAEQKHAELIDTTAQLHFIGHLQSNKAHIAARIFQMIETVDRLKLAITLNKHLDQLGRTVDILVQVNIGNDENKFGIAAKETEDLIKKIAPLQNLRIRGLMTMPPFTEDPEEARPYFQELRSLSEDLQQKNLFSDNKCVELSMGMSNDYPVAIEEGATIIRVGTAIFGHRTEQNF